MQKAMRTSLYITAERNAAAKSAVAAATGDYEEALNLKRVQLYNHYMVRESMKARKIYDRGTKVIRKAYGSKKETWFEQEHYDQICAFLARMGMDKKDYDPALRAEDFPTYLARMQSEYGIVDIADWLVNEDPIGVPSQLTYEQYQDVVDAVRNMRAIVKEAKGENLFNKNMEFAKLKDDVFAHLRKLDVKWTPSVSGTDEAGFFERYLANMQNADTFFEKMDGYEHGFFTELFLEQVTEANDKEFFMMRQFRERLTAATKKWMPDKKTEKAYSEPVYYAELGNSIDRHGLIKMLMYLGSESSSNKLCSNREGSTYSEFFGQSSLWTDDVKITRQNLLDFLSDHLTEADIRYAQEMTDAMGMFWNELAQVERRSKGFRPKAVEAYPATLNINGKDVVFAGGYIPLVRRRDVSSIYSGGSLVQMDLQGRGSNLKTMHTNTGSTKSRDASVYPLDLRRGAEISAVEDSVHDICFRELVAGYRKLINDADVHAAFKQRLGLADMRVLEEFLTKVAQPYGGTNNYDYADRLNEYIAEQTENDNNWNMLRSFYNGFVVQTGRGVVNAVQAAVDSNTARHKAQDPNYQPHEGAQFTNSILQKLRDSSMLTRYDVKPQTDMEMFGNALAEGAGQLAFQALLTWGTGGASAVAGLGRVGASIAKGVGTLAMGASIMGNQYEELRAKGVDVETATEKSLVNAGIQTWLEKLSLAKIMRKIPVKNTTLQKQMREVVERGLTEGVTEFAQQYPEEITNLMALNKDKSTEEILAMVADTDRQAEWFKDATMAGVIGGILGGGAGAINLGMQRAVHRQNIEGVKHDAEIAVKTGADAHDVAGVINTNRGGHAYDIDAEGLMTYLQETADPAKAAETLGLTVEEVQRAAENGEAVQVMAGEFTAMQAQDSTFVDKVGDYTDFIGNGYSPVNEKRQKELATAYAQQAAERTLINEAFEAQLDELTVQLTAAGAKGNVANNFRKIMGQVAYTYNPYDPTAYLCKHPLRVVGVDSNGKVQLDDNGRTIVADAGDQAGTATVPQHNNAQQNNTQQQDIDFFDGIILDQDEEYNQITNATINLDDQIAVQPAQNVLEANNWRDAAKNYTKEVISNLVTTVSNDVHKPYVNKNTGFKIIASKSSINHFLSPTTSTTQEAEQRARETGEEYVNPRTDIDRYKIISELPKIAENAILVEEHADSHGKSDSIYRMFHPMQLDDKIVVVKFTVQKVRNEFQLVDGTFSDKKAYDVLLVKKIEDRKESYPQGQRISFPQSSGMPVSHEGAPQDLPNISIREMLQNVKDQNGNPYINADGTGNFSILTESGKIDFSGNTGFDYLTGDAVYNQEQLQQTAEQALPGTIELNAVSARDQRSRDYMRETLTGDKYGLANEDVDALFDILDAILKRVENIAKEFPTMKAWQERDINDPDLLYRIFKEEYKSTFGAIPTRSSFKKNGDYELNFDFGTLCTKRESMDLIMQLLSDEGYVQNLGPTQIEALKSLLKENGFLTACDICFVESKRVRALNDANKFAFEWKSVLLAVGINDDYEVGYNRELTPEQFNKLMELAGPNFKEAFDKYMPADRARQKAGKADLDTGITADKAKKIAKLMLQDSALAGNFRPEWLLTTRGTDWLVRSFAHTNLANTLAAMLGAATAKPLEGFNIYDALSWAIDFDSKKINMEHIWSIGGFRAQSFTDFNPLLFVDYVQMFIDLEARGLPLHTYTKVPALVELFGETGAMINMSLVPAIVQGATKENAGLKKDKDGNWVYAWAEESFPIEKAMELRKRSEYGGRVGTIAVGVSDKHIKMMLDDPNIDMIIPYHASGMPAAVKLKTGLNVAKNYESEQNTKVGQGKKDTFSYNRALRELGDPRKAAQAYLDYCKENGFTPKFATFKEHPNYYKLLEDFRGYDNDGNPVIQQPVRLKLPKNWEQILRDALGDRSRQDVMRAGMKNNKELMDKARKIVTPQRLDGEIRDLFMKSLKGALGSKNVVSLKNADFLDVLQENYAATMGAEKAAASVEVFRSGDGIAYGFAVGKKIYLNENYFNANTPAHEFTHIWAKVVQSQHQTLWNKGKELLKQSEEWQEVLNDELYSGIWGNEDAVASEVLARIAGKMNEEYIRGLVDPQYKMAKGKGMKAKILEWIKEAFHAIRRLFPNGEDLTYEEFVQLPLKALWDTNSRNTWKKYFDAAAKEGAFDRVEMMAGQKNNARANEALTKAEQKLERDNEAWNQLLDRFRKSNKAEWKEKNNGKLFTLMQTPLVLQLPNIDAGNIPLKVYGSFFEHAVREEHPGMTYDILENLPKYLADPVLVYKNKNSYVALIDLFDSNGAPVVAAVVLNKKVRAFHVNILKTVFGKDKQVGDVVIPDFVKLGKSIQDSLVYINKEKSAAWVQAIRDQFPVGSTLLKSALSANNIHDETDLVKLKEENPGYYQEKTTTAKGFFNPTEGIIGLFKGADASTVIHEGGHFFVENLINDVLSGDCTQQQQQDAAALMDYCGITLEQWQSMSVEERRQYHEKLAEAFESYIIQGVSPSKSLRSVFRKFSEWLTKVYKMAKGEYLNSNRNPNAAAITPEVRAAFDHMLASQEEIAQAERLQGYMNNMPKVVTDNLSESAKRMLEEAIRNAHDKAVEMLTKESMANFTKERRAKIADLKEQLLEPITNQVKQEPLYAAGIELEAHFSKPRRRAETLAKQYLADGAKEEFKAQFDMIAEMYGFSSGSELAQLLKDSPTMAQAVKQRIDAEVQKQYPDIMAERKLAEEKAREALNNDDTGIVIGLEMVLLEEAQARANAKTRSDEAKQRLADEKNKREEEIKQQAAQQRQEEQKKAKLEREQTDQRRKEQARLNNELIAIAARSDIGRTPMQKAMRTSIYITAERNAAAKSAVAAAKGDYEEALNLKRVQLYNHFMVRESMKARKIYDRGTKVIRKAYGNKKETWFEQEHYDQICGLMARMGMVKKDYDPSLRTEDFPTYLARMQAEYGIVDIADWLVNEEQIGEPNQLTLEQYQDVVDAVRNMRAIVRAAKGENLFNKNLAFGQLKNDIFDHLKKLDVKWLPSVSGVDEVGFFERYLANMQNADTFFEKMDGYEYGFFTKLFLEQVTEANDKEFFMMRQFRERLAAATKQWMPDKQTERAYSEPVYYAELGNSIDRHGLIKMLMYLGSESSSNKLCSNRDGSTYSEFFGRSSLWTDDVNITRQNLLDFLSDHLTEADIRYAQEMTDAMGMFWNELAQVERRSKGFRPKAVEAYPATLNINGKDVIFKGGYIPLVRRRDVSSIYSGGSLVQMDLQGRGANLQTMHTNTGSTKSRDASVYPLDLRRGAEISAVEDSVHDICFRELVAGYRKLINDSDIHAAFKQRLGLADMRVLEEYLTKVAQPYGGGATGLADDWLGSAANWMRSRTVNAAIVLNLKTAIQNLANLPLYGQSVEGFGYMDTLLAYTSFFRNTSVTGQYGIIQFVNTKSAFMAERAEIVDISVRDVKEGTLKTADWEKRLLDMGQNLMVMTDNITAVPIWYQAYNKKLNQGASDREALEKSKGSFLYL